MMIESAGDGWGFIDAVNASNMIHWVTALWNACVLWPRCSRFLFQLTLTVFYIDFEEY